MFQDFEVMATTDKAQRDGIFADLHKNGNAQERQAVKWSSARPTGKLDASGHLEHVSVWFVGHPAALPQTVASL